MAEIVLLRGAQEDLVAIFARHDSRFEISIETAFNQPTLFPESAPLYDLKKGIRRILIPESPFAAFYNIAG